MLNIYLFPRYKNSEYKRKNHKQKENNTGHQPNDQFTYDISASLISTWTYLKIF